MNLLLYYGLVLSKKEAGDLDSIRFWVGILMLISAGSFLYVATIHILPEVYDTSPGHGKVEEDDEEEANFDPSLQGYKDLKIKDSETGEFELKKRESKHYCKIVQLTALLLGLYLPVLL